MLNYHKVEYLVVGGYAVAYYGYPRFTGDIDIWINTTNENSYKVANVLREFGFESLGLKPVEFRYSDQIFQLGFPPYRIDLITSVNGLEFKKSYKNKIILKENDITINVISIEDLKKNKKETGRTKDLNDLENLP